MDRPQMIGDSCRRVTGQIDETERRLTSGKVQGDTPKPLRTRAQDVCELLRTTIDRLAGEETIHGLETAPSLPLPILDEAVSSLGGCEQSLSTLSERLKDGLLSSTDEDLGSPESSLLDQLERCQNKLNVILDICTLYLHPPHCDTLHWSLLMGFRSSSNLLGAGNASTSKADMLVSIARMRGLFDSRSPASGTGIPFQDTPPSYDEATHIQTHSASHETLQTGGPSSADAKAADGGANGITYTSQSAQPGPSMRSSSR